MISPTQNPLSSLTDAPRMRGADQGPRRPTDIRKQHIASPAHPPPIEAGPRHELIETGASGSPLCGPIKSGHPAGMTNFGFLELGGGEFTSTIIVIPAKAGTQIHALPIPERAQASRRHNSTRLGPSLRWDDVLMAIEKSRVALPGPAGERSLKPLPRGRRSGVEPSRAKPHAVAKRPLTAQRHSGRMGCGVWGARRLIVVQHELAPIDWH